LGANVYSEERFIQSSIDPIHLAEGIQLSSRFDWRDRNFVTSVKDEGACMSGQAFAIVSAMESRSMISLSYHETDLSEQHIISCDNISKCNGGSLEDTLNFAKENGVVSESCFPYASEANSCENKCDRSSTKIIDFYKVAADDYSIKLAISEFGPIVCYTAVTPDFYSYSAGIYKNGYGWLEFYQPVVLIGYDDVEQYWIGKNSWGSDWGEGGFFRSAYSEGIYNFSEWYYNSSDYRLLFLDYCYAITDTDVDADSIGDSSDNCPWAFNLDQSDIDNNRVGDVCDSVESADSGSSGGGSGSGGSGGGGSSVGKDIISGECTELWTCGGWSGCLDERRSRKCYDLNNCGTLNSKPEEVQSCSSTVQDEKDEKEEVSGGSEIIKPAIREWITGRVVMDMFNREPRIKYASLLLIVIIAGLFVLNLRKSSLNHKSEVVTEFESMYDLIPEK